MEEYVKIRDAEKRIADLIGIETKGRCPTWNEVHEALYADLPSIFIVRCKDCIHWHPGYNCDLLQKPFNKGDDWFCADGEPKDD